MGNSVRYGGVNNTQGESHNGVFVHVWRHHVKIVSIAPIYKEIQLKCKPYNHNKGSVIGAHVFSSL